MLEQELMDDLRETMDFFAECLRPAYIIPALGMTVAGFAMYCGLWLIF